MDDMRETLRPCQLGCLPLRFACPLAEKEPFRNGAKEELKTRPFERRGAASEARWKTCNSFLV